MIDQRVIAGKCPMCKTIIPLVFITVITTGRWRKNVEIKTEGDGTDWLTHVWAHQQGMIDPR